MKSSKKALAFALAAAMVVTAFPVTNAEAASTAKLSTTKVTVAAGTAKKQTKSIKVTTPSTWKSVKVKVSSSNKKVAKVKASGKTVKVTAVKKGSAKVTVKVTAKKGKKAVSKTLKANVKVINAGLKLTTAPAEVVIGSETKFVAKKCPSVAKVTFSSSDAAVATVDAATGVVKALKAGKTTITATSDYGKTVSKEVTVKEIVIDEAKQSKINQVVLTYQGDASKITKDDVVITRTSDNQRIYTKAVSNNATDKKLTVDTILDMTDAKDFTVTVKDSTVKFTATDGKTVSLGLDKTEIVYNTATKLSVVELDANGVELKSTECAGAAGTTNNIEYKIDVTSDKGYVTADGLVLNKTGDTAKVTATKHSGVYKDGKEDGNLTFEGTVTAIDSAAMATGEKWTLTAAKPYDWSKVTENHDMILGEGSNFFMNVKDTKGNDLVNGNPVDAGYTIVSTNKDVLFVDGNAFTPNKVGTAVININDKNGKTVWSYQVTVKEAAKPVSFTLNKTSVTLSNATKTAATADVKVTVKDQYGRKNSDATLVVTNTSKPNSANSVLKNQGTISNGEAVLTFEGSDGTASATKGSYGYKIELKNSTGATVYTATMGVNVQEPNYKATATYSLLLNGENAAATVDETVTADSLDAKAVKVQVGMFYDGVLGDYYEVTDAAISVKTPKNVEVATTTAVVGAAGKRDEVTSPAKDFNFYVRTTSAAATYDQTAAGTYTVSVQVPNASGKGLKDIKQYIIVTNNQPTVVMSKRSATETVDTTKLGTVTNATDAAILAAFEFSYDNNALTSLKNGVLLGTAAPEKGELDESNIVSYDVTNVSHPESGVTRMFVKSVTVKVPVVLGDIATPYGTIDTNDVVYITQTVNAGYYLQFK